MKKINEWIQTDDMQYCRKIEPSHYELIEANEVDEKFAISAAEEVYVEPENDYQAKTISIIKSYYGSVEEFVRLVPNPEDREQYLAEMIYECTSAFLTASNYNYGLLTEAQANFVLESYIKTGTYPAMEDVLKIPD